MLALREIEAGKFLVVVYRELQNDGFVITAFVTRRETSLSKLFSTQADGHRPGMIVTFNPEVDILRILFRDAAIEESDEDKPGVTLDYDKDGNIVGLEVLNASKRVENPRGVDYAVTT